MPTFRAPTSKVIAVMVVAFAALSLTGCGDKCASGDVDCFLAHLVIVRPEADGKPYDLRPIDASVVRKSSGTVPTCSGNATLCNGACVNVAFDATNCGSCGVVCNAPMQCQSGSCQCAPGQTGCGTACVDAMSDPENCGGCGISCFGALCLQGACVGSCPAGRTLCDGGCVDTQNDPANCGACGTTCGAGESCQGGACACTAPQYACGCIDPSSDVMNCGGCGIACASGQTCRLGTCCDPSDAACGGGAEPSSPPAIVNQPEPMDFSDPTELAPLELDYTDPFGCRPGACFQVCSGGRCSSGFMCAPPERDGLTQGVWRSYLGFLVQPADTSADLTTEVTPVSGPNCDETLLDRLEAGDADIEIGVSVSIEITVESPNDYYDSGSGSGSGTTGACSDSAPVCNCAVQACATSDGACWYETSNGTFECNGCDCQAAANAVVSSCCPQQ